MVDIREEDGFGNVDVMNKLMSVMRDIEIPSDHS